MDDRTTKELDRLVRRIRDPRRGASVWLILLRNTSIALFILSFGVLPLTFSAGPLGTELAGLILYGSIFLVLISQLSIKWTSLSTQERAKRERWFLCPWCRYTLTDLPDEGLCPECGNRYERTTCETLYQCAYRAYQPSADEVLEQETQAWTRAIEIRDQES